MFFKLISQQTIIQKLCMLLDSRSFYDLILAIDLDYVPTKLKINVKRLKRVVFIDETDEPSSNLLVCNVRAITGLETIQV